jgi:uncharacterized oligopeptide transporter (OPT) family protein
MNGKKKIEIKKRLKLESKSQKKAAEGRKENLRMDWIFVIKVVIIMHTMIVKPLHFVVMTLTICCRPLHFIVMTLTMYCRPLQFRCNEPYNVLYNPTFHCTIYCRPLQFHCNDPYNVL